MLSDPESTAGKGRATIDEQRNFLIELSLSFYTICSDAIEDRYFHDFFQNDKDSEKFLWANLMNLHVEFPNKFYQNRAPWDEKTTNYIGVGCCDSYKTKNQAITEAYEDIKRTRGREVGNFSFLSLVLLTVSPTHFSNKELTGDLSCPVFQIPSQWKGSSKIIAILGEILHETILQMLGTPLIDSSCLSYSSW